MIFHQLPIALGVISLIGFFASSGKQKRISAFLLGLSLLLGIISFSVLSPYSPPSTEQSAGQQGQANQSPISTPTHNLDWRRETLPSSRKAIILEKSETIFLPKGKKRLFLSHMGNKEGDLSPVITIGGEKYSAKGAGDFLLPEGLEGKVEVNFNGWDDKSYPGGLDAYQYYKTKKPFIELVE